uniref:Serine/threonine protein kinase n=1 Tax=Solibacter usitatus (strain Ellin6076) TaxID=234267 RepID=Q020S4_SOLUE
MLGKSIAHYLVVERLGQGGMGVVYKARDSHLDRFVALKVLPPERVADPERKRRFVQEAKAASALNHPNIIHIYDIAKDGDIDYIAMELIEGRTLASVIGQRGLRTEQILKYGTQVADALAKSHGAGVIHRDLKPTNIMVTDAGLIKVLDFGLAKLADNATDEFAPTRTVRADEIHTEDGTVMGTLAYMSPEQAQGKQVDGRSDIFSLGAVLYEMAAGRSAFWRDSRASTMAAILRDDPVPLPAEVGAGLRGVIGRCLVKEPSERYQQATEVRAALEAIRDSSTEQTAAPATRRRRPRLAWLAAGGAALGILGAAWWMGGYGASAPQLSGLRLASTFAGSHRSATFSPDGSMIAFLNTANGPAQIWVKNLAQGDPIQITSGNLPAVQPHWSPKNDQIVFSRQGQGIWSVPPLGGTPRQLIRPGRNPNFSGDGERLVFERGHQIWVARTDGSEARRVEGVPEWYYGMDSLPALSAHGEWIAFSRPQIGPHGDLWVIPSAGGKARRLTFDTRISTGPVWTPDDQWIIYSSMRGGSFTLWRVAAAGGKPEALTTGAGEDTDAAISSDGRHLIYTNARNTWKLALLDLATGKQKELMERRNGLAFPSFSPDGERIAFMQVAAGDPQIFTIRRDGTEMRQMTLGKGEINGLPRWSADGAFVYYYRAYPTPSFRKVPAAGGADTEVIAGWSWETHNAAQEDPGGGRLAYTLNQKNNQVATLVREIASGKETRLSEILDNPRWSPDGTALVGTMADQGVIRICPVAGGACTGVAKGSLPVWESTGAKIYFWRHRPETAGQYLWSIDLKTREEKELAALGSFSQVESFYDISRSGQVITTPFREGRTELWMADLKRQGWAAH